MKRVLLNAALIAGVICACLALWIALAFEPLRRKTRSTEVMW